MSVRFGTGGWRAVIGDGFTRANIRLLCTALAQQLQADGKAQQGFVIGYADPDRPDECLYRQHPECD